MAKTLKRPVAKPKNHPSGASLLDHDEVYAMYRALGAGRSIRRLVDAVSLRWPANPVATGTIGNWASKEDWAKLINEYELGFKDGSAHAIAAAPSIATGDVDDVGVLERAASQALAAALAATSVAVRSPSDVKALVETANKALELADRLKAQRSGVATSQEIAEFGRELLADIDKARRKDFIFMAKTAAESACQAAGTTNLVEVLKKVAGSLGMRVNDDGVFYDYSEAENNVKGKSDDSVDVGADHISKPGVVWDILDGAELEGKEQPRPLQEVKDDDVHIGGVDGGVGGIAGDNPDRGICESDFDMRQQMARTQTLEDELARQQSSVWGEASSNAVEETAVKLDDILKRLRGD